MKAKEFKQGVKALSNLLEAYALVHGFIPTDYSYKWFLGNKEFKLRNAEKCIKQFCCDYIGARNFSEKQQRTWDEFFNPVAQIGEWKGTIEMLKRADDLILNNYYVRVVTEAEAKNRLVDLRLVVEINALMLALGNIREFIGEYKTIEELSTKEGFRGLLIEYENKGI